MKKLLLLFLLPTIFASAQRKQYEMPDTLWSFNAHGLTPQYPYVDDKLVILGNDYGRVFALDALTGKTRWEYKGPEKNGHGKNAIIHCIAGDAKNVYFNNCSASMMALDKNTGKLIWKIDNSHFDDDILARIIQTDSTIIVNTLVPSILCLRKKDGTISWEFTDFNYGTGPTAIVREKNDVYFTCFDSTLYSISMKDGKKNWSIKTGAGAAPFGPAIAGDNIVVSYYKSHWDTVGTIECYGISDHKLKWKQGGSPSYVFSSGTHIFSMGNGMHCLDPATGKELWMIKGDHSWYTAPVFKEGKIFYQNRMNNLLSIIDEASGKILQQYACDGKTYSVPVVTDNYIFYGLDHSYYCMKRK